MPKKQKKAIKRKRPPSKLKKKKPGAKALKQLPAYSKSFVVRRPDDLILTQEWDAPKNLREDPNDVPEVKFFNSVEAAKKEINRIKEEFNLGLMELSDERVVFELQVAPAKKYFADSYSWVAGNLVCVPAVKGSEVSFKKATRLELKAFKDKIAEVKKRKVQEERNFAKYIKEYSREAKALEKEQEALIAKAVGYGNRI